MTQRYVSLAPGSESVGQTWLMPHLEIEYLDGLDHGSIIRQSEPGRRVHLTDSRFATFAAIVGVLITIAAVVVSVALAFTYTPSVGDPLGPPRFYQPASGVPWAADLVIGTIGLVLGLGLVSLSRLVANSAATLSHLVAIRALLTEHDPNVDDDEP